MQEKHTVTGNNIYFIVFSFTIFLYLLQMFLFLSILMDVPKLAAYSRTAFNQFASYAFQPARSAFIISPCEFVARGMV